MVCGFSELGHKIDKSRWPGAYQEAVVTAANRTLGGMDSMTALRAITGLHSDVLNTPALFNTASDPEVLLGEHMYAVPNATIAENGTREN